MQFRFASFYLVSLVLLGIIFIALWTGTRNKKEKAVVQAKALSENQQLLDADQSLHANLRELQRLDEQFIFILSDSAMLKNPHSRSDSLEKLSSTIYDTEQIFSKAIEHAERITDSTFSPADKEMAAGMVSNFKTALNTHKAVSNLSMVLAARSLTGNDMQVITKWQNELQKKDNRIKTLEEQVKKVTNEKTTAQLLFINSKQANPGQKIAGDLETKNSYLQNVNKALKEDNDRLLAEIVKINQLQENGDAVSKEKSDLERRVKDLTGELSLAQVDCNLSRADAKQIVYNSKQRKDLLAEALSVLNNLSQTGSATLQKKVKEKTIQLQTIANTVRD